MWRGGRRRGTDPYAVLLLVQLGQQIAQLERKPPVTLAVIAACFLAFYNDVLPPHLRPPAVEHACLQPFLIVKNHQWGRLIWSALLHADEVHLCYNMASFLYKGAILEPHMGHAKFAALLAELLVLSHGLVVAVSAVASAYIPDYQYLWFSSCAVGFSAVIFALKVVLQHDAPGYSSVFGFRLPTKYLAWAELFVASALNPRASFLGHLCGILAGLLHVKYLAPAATRLLRWLRQQRRAAASGAAARSRQNAARAAAGPARGTGNSSSSGPAANTAAAAAAAAQQRIADTDWVKDDGFLKFYPASTTISGSVSANSYASFNITPTSGAIDYFTIRASVGGESTPRILELRWDQDNYANSLACTDILTVTPTYQDYSFKLPAFSASRTFRLFGAVPAPPDEVIRLWKIQFLKAT